MQTISKSHFDARFAPLGIGLDMRYAPPQTIVFREDPHIWRPWSVPSFIQDVPGWISSIIDGACAGGQIFIYPRVNAWAGRNSLQTFQYRSFFAFVGLAPNAEDVLVADEKDRDLVESLVLVSLTHGRTVSDDIFLIPEKGNSIISVDHHEALTVHFRDKDMMTTFVKKFSPNDEPA